MATEQLCQFHSSTTLQCSMSFRSIPDIHTALHHDLARWRSCDGLVLQTHTIYPGGLVCGHPLFGVADMVQKEHAALPCLLSFFAACFCQELRSPDPSHRPSHGAMLPATPGPVGRSQSIRIQHGCIPRLAMQSLPLQATGPDPCLRPLPAPASECRGQGSLLSCICKHVFLPGRYL